MRDKTFIDAEVINSLLQSASEPSPASLAAILEKGRELRGLSLAEAAGLLSVTGEGVLSEIFETAAHIKSKVYGERLVLFAPLYLSNFCVNDCAYCGFHASNPGARKRLAFEEIKEQTERLIEMGHKRLLLEAGEDPDANPIDYVLDAIDTVYGVKTEKGEIRRLNVNIAATTAENYARLKEKGIGTYQLFAETYHRATYEALHRGPKADYERQLFAIDNAFLGGIDDVGIGVLFGLYDWRFEVLSIISHASYLSEKYGVGPHTVSVPRFRPASTVGFEPLYPVSDDDFLRLIAILRIALPSAGMIITTRESPGLRAKAFGIGITQASAASTTAPGGFCKSAKSGKRGRGESEQFELSDKRSLGEVARDVMAQGLTPSFCTACYRKSRTGAVFMDIAGRGEIQEFCEPNSILTLMEYLIDNAGGECRATGMELVEKSLKGIEDPLVMKETRERIERIRHGERDLFF